MKFYTTLSELAKARACCPRYKHLVKALGGMKFYGKNTPLSYSKILEINGIDDCIWALEHGNYDAKWLLSLWGLACAQRAEKYTCDLRVREGNRINHLSLHGEIVTAEMAALAAASSARGAAWAAANAAAARAVGWDAWAAERGAARESQKEELRVLLIQMEMEIGKHPGMGKGERK